MPDLATFLRDVQGSRYRNEHASWPLNFAAILNGLDDPAWQARMIASSRAGRPALAGVVMDIEGRPDVASYFRTTDSHETRRFRQAIGVGVRIAMERLGWRTTGRKLALGRRIAVAPDTTTPGAHRNDPADPATWFSKAEVYAPAAPGARPGMPGDGPSGPDSPIRPGAVSAGRTPAERAALLEQGLDRIASIGTPEERAETLELLMTALAETRRSEGRIF